ncbi:mycothiol synthase, partial [Nocardioides kribbensis]|uniref:mycothiol synthase n=1 Tax=Nocardioides kribbensis TaxID=305517 RepID=UPI0032DB3A99
VAGVDRADGMDEIERIAAAAEAHDGAAPLDEATWRTLRRHPERARHRMVDGGFALVVGRELTVVVDPPARGAGVASGLVSAELAEAGGGELLAWSHGNHPAAAALAAAYGFERVRDLWVMRRAMAEPLPGLVVPDGVTVRSYVDTDADEVVRVNAAAFAHHPEQGAMDRAELAERMAEAWFDPAGLVVAERDGSLVGFHWTKQHSPDLGEVYVVGVDPVAQGQGLGRVVTLAGLHHLAGLGVGEVLLYVESDNEAAVATYSRLGFGHAALDTHVQYRRG